MTRSLGDASFYQLVFITLPLMVSVHASAILLAVVFMKDNTSMVPPVICLHRCLRFRCTQGHLKAYLLPSNARATSLNSCIRFLTHIVGIPLLVLLLIGICLLVTFAVSSTTVTECSAALLRTTASEPRLGLAGQWLWVIVNCTLLVGVDWYVIRLSRDRAKERGMSLHRCVNCPLV